MYLGLLYCFFMSHFENKLSGFFFVKTFLQSNLLSTSISSSASKFSLRSSSTASSSSLVIQLWNDWRKTFSYSKVFSNITHTMNAAMSAQGKVVQIQVILGEKSSASWPLFHHGLMNHSIPLRGGQQHCLKNHYRWPHVFRPSQFLAQGPRSSSAWNASLMSRYTISLLFSK